MLDTTQVIHVLTFLLEKLSPGDRRDTLTGVLEERLVKEALDERQLASILSEKLAERRERTVQEPVSKTGSIRKSLTWESPGTLNGTIKGPRGEYKVSVTQFPGRRFTNGTYVNGIQRRRLTMGFVEGGLGLKVNRKSTGGNSETLSRTIFRHLVDRYNNGDETVSFEPLGTSGSPF